MNAEASFSVEEKIWRRHQWRPCICCFCGPCAAARRFSGGLAVHSTIVSLFILIWYYHANKNREMSCLKDPPCTCCRMVFGWLLLLIKIHAQILLEILQRDLWMRSTQTTWKMSFDSAIYMLIWNSRCVMSTVYMIIFVTRLSESRRQCHCMPTSNRGDVCLSIVKFLVCIWPSSLPRYIFRMLPNVVLTPLGRLMLGHGGILYIILRL